MYTELVSGITCKIEDTDWKKVCASINTFSEEHLQNIAILIYHHYYINEGQLGKTHLPYGGHLHDGRRGIMYTMAQLPPQLQLILAEYVKRVTSS